MSEKKQVIHVKDLVIKADNVIIEGTQQQQRRRDPFFGRYIEDDRSKDVEAAQDVEHKPQEENKDDDGEDEDKESEPRFERRPFSWF
ncbi:hypothetical protein J2Z83_001160 [Virgibacillus natechei]|uniref:Uncharacterized protein n=1 Tax=Virgibacillus natechei TaxID=1216297 RepID=A0ABS4IDP0_9BACI|nr:hypothetical protein [Virgibacillus natechei]MBP1969057.1 hypothetical protein [Virgibacillus natechei]UZD14327.1 hypothetical protein OLD84_07430 [Virgibacillus natechei]